MLFQNLVEPETRIIELRLDHNLLQSLDGALMGVHGLQKLNLSNNLLDKISPDDLIGLENLRILDVSFNRLTTLEETSKVQPRITKLETVCCLTLTDTSLAFVYDK
jgi:Leucine-rich repeat (LRR) protein